MADIFEIVGKISLDGLDRAEKELKEFSNEGEQSASKLSKLGSVAKTLGKGILVGAGAVATGAVALVKSVSGAYGQLQQSIGGIETLFGKSAQKVIKNANNAYTTAGISANEYMQQVTSFSASLLQSLGGDTEKAANAADMAVRDMADNANKMGTSIEMIQNAYQGFSKQNYTMLDNLKLGYGGTKAEMERLLKDAEKISSIKYDINNLNDVYSAIHVVQQELGITGTTAKEAGETIEGSFNSLSASWENFIAGLGNPDADMAKIVDNLAKGLSGAINNVIPVINNMVSVLPTVMDAIIGAVEDLAPTFISTFTELITKVIDAIIPLLPTVIPLFVDMLVKVGLAIAQNAPLLIDGFVQLITQLTVAISQNLPTLIPIFIECIVQIGNAIIQNAPIILDAILSIGSNLSEGLSPAINACIGLVEVLTGAFIAFKAGAMIQSVVQGFQSAQVALSLFKLETQGSSIAQGLLNGQLTIGQTVVGLLTGQVTLAEIATGLWSKAQGVLNAVMSANPIALVVVAIGALIAIVVVAYNKCDWFRNLVNQLGDNIKRVFTSMIEWFKKLPETVSNAVTSMVNFIKQLPEKIGYWLGFVIGTVAKFVIEFPAKAKEAGTNFVKNLINFIKNLPSNVANWLTNTISKVASFAINIGSKAKQAGTNIFNGIVNTIKNLPSKLSAIGTNIVKGLWNGITGAGNWLKNKITGFAGGILKGFKSAFGIHSPSILMRDEVGTYLSQGLGVGIEEDDSAEKSIRNKVDSIIGVANNSMSDIRIGSSVSGLVGDNPVQKYQIGFDAQFSTLNDGFERLLSLIGQYLPDIASNMDRNIVLDGNSLAAGISRKIDTQLGKMSVAKGRGNV